jgi:transcriptional regulator with XRE-family HTH domain
VYEARELTAQLAQLRLAANLSQRQAAKRAGVDQADVSRIESGQITPSLPTLLRLLDAVGATLVLARRPAPLKSAAPGRRESGATTAFSGSGSRCDQTSCATTSPVPRLLSSLCDWRFCQLH